MTVRTDVLTAEDLLWRPDDGCRCELIRGELRQMTPSGPVHGRVTVRLTWRLARHVEENGLGEVFAAETGFLLSTDPDTVRAPDIAFVRRERVAEMGDVEGYWPAAPDLVVEVISPGDAYTAVEEKALEWLAAGTRMVVAVDPRTRTATVYRSRTDIAILAADDVLDGSDVVPGWSVPVGDLFS